MEKSEVIVTPVDYSKVLIISSHDLVVPSLEKTAAENSLRDWLSYKIFFLADWISVSLYGSVSWSKVGSIKGHVIVVIWLVGHIGAQLAIDKVVIDIHVDLLPVTWESITIEVLYKLWLVKVASPKTPCSLHSIFNQQGLD